MTGDEVHIGELRFDPVSHRVTAGGESLSLGPTEFRLLHFLLTHPERVHQEPVCTRNADSGNPQIDTVGPRDSLSSSLNLFQ